MYNSIQDGACCRLCLFETAEKERAAGRLVAVSERFRTNSAMVVSKLRDHLEGLPPDPLLGDEYVDRIVIEVPDDRDEGTNEIMILSGSLSTKECFCVRE